MKQTNQTCWLFSMKNTSFLETRGDFSNKFTEKVLEICVQGGSTGERVLIKKVVDLDGWAWGGRNKKLVVGICQNVWILKIEARGEEVSGLGVECQK